MKSKRVIALIMCAALALSMLAGCGSGNTAAGNAAGNASNAANTANAAENTANSAPAEPSVSEEDMAKLTDISRAGLKVYESSALVDGTYDIDVLSGSEQFKIKDSKLVVVANVMQLVLTVEGKDCTKIFAGSAADAKSSPSALSGEEKADGTVTFRLPVRNIGAVTEFAAYSEEHASWYNRTLLADTATLDSKAVKPVETADNNDKQGGTTPAPAEDTKKPEPTPAPQGNTDTKQPENTTPAQQGNTDTKQPENTTPAPAENTDPPKEDTPAPSENTEPEKQGLADGDYPLKVTFSGGTGKARITSATLHVKGGNMTATVKWSSENYDYMKVGGQKILPSSTAGGCVFTIPVPVLGQGFSIIGDTTTMSTPHEIEYTLQLDLQ